MKTSFFVCLSAVLLASSAAQAELNPVQYSIFERALADSGEEYTFRGQSPGPVLMPPVESTTVFQPPPYDPNSVLMDQNVSGGVPYQQPYPAPVPYDPWSTGNGGGLNPYGTTPGSPGLVGPQPYRFNTWTDRFDFFYISNSPTSSPAIGNFQMSGIDINKDYPIMLPGNWVMTPSFDYGARFLSGPVGTATNSNLPGSVNRFGLGVKLATPMTYGWGLEGSFEPWLATDFGGPVNSQSFLFDGQLAALWQMSPQMMWVLGISYWDRVDNIVLPYAGLVWTPNDYWEFRLVFPKPRVTAFIGAPFGIPTWAYGMAEYHVEAYQVDSLNAPNTQDQVQFADWRMLGGLRFETSRITSFLEAGWVFDRKVKFDKYGGDFNVDSGFIAYKNDR